MIYRLKIKHPLIFLILLIVSLMLFFIRIEKNDKYYVGDEVEILVLADRNNPRKENSNEQTLEENARNRRIEFIGVNSNNINCNYIVSHPYPYVGIDVSNPHLRNIVGNNDTNKFLFVNIGDETNEYIYFKIKLKSKENMIEIGENRKIIGTDLSKAYFTNIDPKGNRIMINDGFMFDTKSEKFSTVADLRSKEDKVNFNYHRKNVCLTKVLCEYPYVQGAIFVDNDIMVLQAPGNEKKQEYIGQNQNINLMILYSERNKKENKIIESGFYPIRHFQSNNGICPINVSPEGDKLAFLSRYPDESKEISALWLAIWHINSNMIERTALIDSSLINIESPQRIIRWSPGSNPGLIAMIDFNCLIIIDTKNKNVIKKFMKVCPKNVRWSPDGEKIAFLEFAEYKINDDNSVYEVINPARLWIYDLKNDVIKKVAEDPDYFDFFWIK